MTQNAFGPLLYSIGEPISGALAGRSKTGVPVTDGVVERPESSVPDQAVCEVRRRLRRQILYRAVIVFVGVGIALDRAVRFLRGVVTFFSWWQDLFFGRAFDLARTVVASFDAFQRLSEAILQRRQFCLVACILRGEKGFS